MCMSRLVATKKEEERKRDMCKRGKGNARYRINDECGQRGCRASRAFCTCTHIHTHANQTRTPGLFRCDISTGLSSRTKEHDERKIEIVTEYGCDVKYIERGHCRNFSEIYEMYIYTCIHTVFLNQYNRKRVIIIL